MCWTAVCKGVERLVLSMVEIVLGGGVDKEGWDVRFMFGG